MIERSQQRMFSKGRGIVLVLLFLAGVINYLDRSAFSVASFHLFRKVFVSMRLRWAYYLAASLLVTLSLTL